MDFDTTTSRIKVTKHYSKKPSKVLGLGNLFGPKHRRDKDYLEELCQEVKEECENYGKVRSVKADAKNMLVYVRFRESEGAMLANENLQNRVFSDQPIATGFFTKKVFERKR